MDQPLLMNCGCGMPGTERLPGFFDSWRQVRVDVDPVVTPDILANITDLTVISNDTADAIWSAHCIEHLFGHEVVMALKEMRRVLNDDGFVCIVVPDLQTVCNHIASDRLHEVLYQSPAGPITAHDVVFGLGGAIARGRTSMAHRCGFTPTLLLRRLQEAGFAEVALRRRPTLELAAVARKTASPDSSAPKMLLDALQL